MTALPTQMIDRWQHRADPAPGEGTVYWHMPMDGYPEVVSLARSARQRLAPFGGLHMTPLERLHMTTMVAGPASDFTADQLVLQGRTLRVVQNKLPRKLRKLDGLQLPPRTRSGHAGERAIRGPCCIPERT